MASTSNNALKIALTVLGVASLMLLATRVEKVRIYDFQGVRVDAP
jgi:hypothetical protein